MDIRPFTLDESVRIDLEELLFQLSGKRRTITLVNYPNVYCVGVFDEGKLVGFAQLFIMPKTTFTMAYLEDVVVHEAYRGQGLGRKLMEAVIALAQEKGVHNLNLTVRPERSAARSLYEVAGFQEVGNAVLRLSFDI